VLVDSESGKRAMVDGYGVDERRIHVLPFVPPSYVGAATTEADVVRVRARYQLPEFYLLFPTKFHAHKNHLGLLDALQRLRDTGGEVVPLVLVGSKSNDDTFDRVMHRIQADGLSSQVHYLGYVPDEDMGALYKAAGALVFPTFLGPTAIPVLEAFATGCPVICSNVAGFDEQVGNAGILVDPSSAADLARAIHDVHTNQELRRSLAEKSRRRFGQFSPDGYGERITRILDSALAS
jgi:glycosyltransferase involved in cell wall biosynthesis